MAWVTYPPECAKQARKSAQRFCDNDLRQGISQCASAFVIKTCVRLFEAARNYQKSRASEVGEAAASNQYGVHQSALVASFLLKAAQLMFLI